MSRIFFLLNAFLILSPLVVTAQEPTNKVLKAGAAVVDISPTNFPVIVNGGFLEVLAKAKVDDLYARALVLDDGKNQIALVVVDSCMMPRDFLDPIKRIPFLAALYIALRSACSTHLYFSGLAHRFGFNSYFNPSPI